MLLERIYLGEICRMIDFQKHLKALISVQVPAELPANRTEKVRASNGRVCLITQVNCV